MDVDWYVDLWKREK